MSQLMMKGLGPTGASSGFDPNSISGLKLWLKADSGPVKNGGGSPSDGDSVTTWTDKSAIGNSVSQGTVANMPLYKTGIQNGLPGILFDGSNDTMTKTSPTGLFSTSFTFFSVIRTATTATQQVIAQAGLIRELDEEKYFGLSVACID